MQENQSGYMRYVGEASYCWLIIPSFWLPQCRNAACTCGTGDGQRVINIRARLLDRGQFFRIKPGAGSINNQVHTQQYLFVPLIGMRGLIAVMLNSRMRSRGRLWSVYSCTRVLPEETQVRFLLSRTLNLQCSHGHAYTFRPGK